jgi:hypothetical protein
VPSVVWVVVVLENFFINAIWGSFKWVMQSGSRALIAGVHRCVGMRRFYFYLVESFSAFRYLQVEINVQVNAFYKFDR